LYYKAYIQTLEIRRVKFKKSHTNRAHKFYKDLQQYVRLANEVFEKKYPEEQKQTPINYITFHQKFRKLYQVNMQAEEALLKVELEE
jgi:hypothetical protein